MTPAGIEPATIRFLAQHLNHCGTAEVDIVYFIDSVSVAGLLQRKAASAGTPHDSYSTQGSSKGSTVFW